ncbi:MFS transporter [Aliiglaciecola sp. CAU 1673]|nr:MFS transporter [Aliiglaciecola sp. CAU 1673]MDF2177402.1 MFS transporter [Aliiglaciecola sp. CAU 1673]
MHWSPQQSTRALFLATLAFAANFSVWTLYAAMTEPLLATLQLSLTELGVLLSAPMLTGALTRIPAGLLADRLGARRLWCVQMLLCLPPLWLLPQAQSFDAYLLLGLWIGLSGSSFALGIRYISDFFPRQRQGTAMGIFGVGNAGAAINLLLVPLLMQYSHYQMIGPIYTLGLGLVLLVFWLFAPHAPIAAAPASEPPLSIKALLGRIHIWRLALYYYFVFGSFLALLMWLPHYYMKAYSLSIQQAMAFTLLFVASSSVVRSLGGWFADRYGGRAVNWTVFWICLVCLFFLSYPPTTMTIHGIDKDVHLSIAVNLWWFTGLLVIIGLAQGFGRASVYKLIHDRYPQQMGAVGGLVGAIGALGGCTLPLLFGLLVDWSGFYSICFMLLYGVLAACMAVSYFAIQAERFERRVAQASEQNFLEQD